MRHIQPAQIDTQLPLHGSERSRLIERAAMAKLPAQTLMQRAARAVFQWGRALYPHARNIWVACGPGNNGGDGLLAAACWQIQARSTGTQITVTWSGEQDRLPTDARYALEQAKLAGVHFADSPVEEADLCIDAMLGLGINSPVTGQLGAWAKILQQTTSPVLCVDLPSGLNPDHGHWFNDCPTLPNGPRHTLSLLTLKPGLFTATGRETAGDIWWDDLGIAGTDSPADAWLYAAPPAPVARQHRHNAHKGDHGDLLIFGGQDISVNGQGMTGAALLAARAGLRCGAGRVYVGLLSGQSTSSFAVDTLWPELMFRDSSALLNSHLVETATSVCGCGGGVSVKDVMPHLLQSSARLVLDADGLNALSEFDTWKKTLTLRSQRGMATVLTPHPLEAARLLKTTAQDIQANRLQAAQKLADTFDCVAVLKGSGTVVAAPGRSPFMHATGNALLATAGTGDVLAGMIGAHLCHQTTHPRQVFEATCQAVHQHGLAANLWQGQGFSASSLVEGLIAL